MKPLYNFLKHKQKHIVLISSLLFSSYVSRAQLDNVSLEGQNLDAITPAGKLVIGNGAGMANAPFGSSNWWHVLSFRHHNPGNNFITQISGEFFGNRLAFRNTQSTTNSPWNEIYHSGNLNSIQHSFTSKDITLNGILMAYNKDNTTATWDNVKLWADGQNAYLEGNGEESGFIIRSNGGHKILLMDQVGIGTASPKEMLSVNGNIRAREVKVETSNWPDYVFEKGYQLPDLEETENYINTHKHLTGVPASAVVEKEGVSLGEMNKILLKKIEELTLHLINQEKQLKVQKKEIDQLKQLK